jgi:hypothetical protein
VNIVVDGAQRGKSFRSDRVAQKQNGALCLKSRKNMRCGEQENIHYFILEQRV